jgi:photosystem II stability/assembly factor-like uncharacterized protein
MMKKLLLVFLLLIINYSLLITNCFSQLPPHYYWRTIPSPVQTNLNMISESTSYPVYVIGDNGTLLRSQNNGYSYSIVPGLLNYNFYDIRISNLSKYTVVGQNGTIYYFSDNYVPIFALEPSGTSANLYSVSGNKSLINPPIFRRIAVGSGGTIINSTWNVGSNWSSWTAVPSGTVQDLYSIDFYSYGGNVNPYGCIAGNNGIILRTTNFGDNWSIINAGITNKLNCVRFVDTVRCWITGSNGLIMKSTNRGLNWVIIPGGTTSDLKFFSGTYSNYYICGSGGTILRSNDTGMTWTLFPTQIQNNFNSILYPTFVGNSGTIIRRDIDSSYIFKTLEGNNIKSFLYYSGIFDQNTTVTNSPGFEWPKGSNKNAIFTAGLSIAAYYQGALREAMASYMGENMPGICNNGNPFTNDSFKVYSVKRSDGPASNPDWLYWGLMVPYGAPFVDVNNNGIYEPQIDTPGVKNASQTVFICYTDGFTSTHNPGEGFGGGTLPLYTEVHLTAWCYSQLSYADMQFLKFVIINKSNQPWTRAYFSLVSDPDIGSADDDYIGCDTSRKLAFGYNGDNDDPVYGIAPPAAGFLLLKGAYNKYSNPQKQLDMTSFTQFHGGQPVFCEIDPVGEPVGAYHYMQGYKRDSTCWLDPTQLVTPPNYYKKTKFTYPGDPETNFGWTEYKGSIENCNHDSSGTPLPINPKGDRRLVMNSGAENLTVMPGDTQTIVICQLIARGSSNLNSVTKLKQLADVAREFYNSGYIISINKIGNEIPSSFSLSQNYPNPFNPTTKIRFTIAPLLRGVGEARGVLTTLKVFDILGREIQTLVNEKLNPGTYEVTFDGSNFASGIYFYRLTTDDFIDTKKLILLK